jgi:hypothetical protein
MGRTKDEHFVVELYKAAKAAGNLEETFDRYEIGSKASLHPKAVNAICRLLIQANFIKKNGEDGIYLTPHGLKLAEQLILSD